MTRVSPWWLLAPVAGLMIVSCSGGGGNSSPTPAPATPVSPTTPPTTPSSSNSELSPEGVSFAGRPREEAWGYQDGDDIVVDIRWRNDVEISGSPTLAIDIGENQRLAGLDRHLGHVLRFSYEVQNHDYDQDGITIPADAMDLDGGNITSSSDGRPVDTDLGEHAVMNSPQHKVRAAIGVSQTWTLYSPDQYEIGYLQGDTFGLGIKFTSSVKVVGVPKLRLEIGGEERFARFESQKRPTDVRFHYRIGINDHDADGISVPDDAIDLSGGSIVAYYRADTPVHTDLGRHAIDNSPGHKVRDFSAGVGLQVAQVEFFGGPADPSQGYLDGETIRIDIRWDDYVVVEGWPRLLIEVGNEKRYAIFNRVQDEWVRFRYLVRYDDHDPDGISIPEDALDLHEGAIVSLDGQVPVNTDLGFDAIENAYTHEVRRTMPFPDVRDCSIERREVRRHPAGFLLDEWDGTPFRVDIVRNFPSFVTDEDLLELLEPIDSLADDIEEQLGYRIVEKGGIVSVPPGMPTGWNRDYHRYGEPPYVLRRRRGQLLAFYMDDDSSFWDHRGGAPNVAFTSTGTTSYNRRTMSKWWRDEDPCCTGQFGANGRQGNVLVHEVAHLLGFEHPDVPFGTPGVRMAWGSLMAPWLSGSRVHFFAEKDIEVLRCIFPQRR